MSKAQSPPGLGGLRVQGSQHSRPTEKELRSAVAWLTAESDLQLFPPGVCPEGGLCTSGAVQGASETRCVCEMPAGPRLASTASKKHRSFSSGSSTSRGLFFSD